MNSKVTVVLVNYNDSQYMEEFFDSVHRQTYENIDVVLVDNASVDSSLTWIKDNEPKIKVIALNENVGFGEGCNIGAKWALDNGTEYVLFLNIDTVIEPNLVSELVKAADNNTVTTALTYCGVRDAHEVWYSGGKIDYTTANTFQTLYKADETEERMVEFISGCCMLIHRNIFETVGYFKKEYYLYYEDTDFCVRLRKSNVNMKYISTTSLWHKVGGSSLGQSETSCSTQYYVTRNRLLFADRQGDFFKHGNLGVMKSILEERAFFDGKQNEKYQLYVQTAFKDYLRGYFGEGYYGKRLIKEHFYLPEDFYEMEEDGLNDWFWSKSPKARIILANARKKDVAYRVLFEISAADVSKKNRIDIDLPGIGRKTYTVPGHIEFSMMVKAEECGAIYFNYHGMPVADVKQGNERALYFQIVNFKAEEKECTYYLDSQFLDEEGTDERFNWCTKKESALYIFNNDKRDKTVELNMQAESVDNCVHDLIISDENGRVFNAKMPGSIKLPIELKANTTSRLSLKTDAPVISEGDRKLSFMLKNISLAESEQEIYFGGNFYHEETDGYSTWHWCSADNERIYISNNTDTMGIYKLTFVVGSYTEKSQKVVVRVDGRIAWKGKTDERCGVLLKLCPKTVSVVSVEVDIPILTEYDRSVCFRMNNAKLEAVSEDCVFDESFYGVETDNESCWRWSGSKTSRIKLINRKHTIKNINVRLMLMPFNDKYMSHKYEILLDKVLCHSGNIGDTDSFWVELPPDSVSELEIRSNCVPEIDGDRQLAYCIYNLQLQEQTDGFGFDDSLYGEESNGTEHWRWSKESRVGFSVKKSGCRKYGVTFAVNTEVQPQDKSVEVCVDNEKVLHHKLNDEIYVELSNEYRDVHRIEIRTKVEPFSIEGDDRSFTFRLTDYKIS